MRAKIAEPSPVPPPSVDPVIDQAELSVGLNELAGKLAAYLKPDDLRQIESAYWFSVKAHEGQFRASGDPYHSHPFAVASILADWHLDTQALVAALLHDVTEDTQITSQEIAERFGKVAADLVDGVSKLDKIESQSLEEAQAGNFRKMLLAMARDVRVILIKLADRLHNMRTLESVPPRKRHRVARETLDIYAPIANRLGLNALYRELEEHAFLHLYPLRYGVLAKAIKAARGNRREVVSKILDAINERLLTNNVQAEVIGREKHLYSIYRKMRAKTLSFSQVLDIYGFRVVVKDVPTCYQVLGILHGLYKPVPGKFKDYLAIPKANGYQSLHTTLIGPYGTPVEVQIRTLEMHHVAETGVASHWLYKDAEESVSELQRMTHNWLQSLLELQTSSVDSAEFLEHVKIDLFPGEVYVFTPKGKILALPRGATSVDFAYAVHTDIGNRCVACRINHELSPLRTELKNGDQVEIITATHDNPNPSWLNYVRTGKARSQIRHFLKNRQFEQSAQLGERLLNQALGVFNTDISGVDPSHWERVLRDSGAKSRPEILADIGLGKRLAAVVARRLLRTDEAVAAEVAAPNNTVSIRGSEGMAVQFGSCCRPLPGDQIIGSIKKGQGLVIQIDDCAAIRKSRLGEPENWIDVEWEPAAGVLFETRIHVEARNRRGVLARIAAEIADAGSDIQSASMEGVEDDVTSFYFTLKVSGRVQLARVMRALRRIEEVERIARVRELN